MTRPDGEIAEDSPEWRWITGQTCRGVPQQGLARGDPQRRQGAGRGGLARVRAVGQGLRQPVPGAQPDRFLQALRRARGADRAGRQDHRVDGRQHGRHRAARGRGDARPADRAAVRRRAAHGPASAGHLDAGRGADRRAGRAGHHRGRPLGHRGRAVRGGHPGHRAAAAAHDQPRRPAGQPGRARRRYPAVGAPAS